MRAYEGTVCTVASLLWCWLPSLRELYAALHAGRAPGYPRVWTRQFHHTTIWIAAFLEGRRASLIIT